MKKIFITISLLLLLAGASFCAGAFFAYQEDVAVKPETESRDAVKIENPLNKVSDVPQKIETAIKTEPIVPEPPAQELAAIKPKFSFAILGDTQYFKPGTNGGYQKSAASIKKLNPNLVFALGDLISSCNGGSECKEKYNSWKNVLGAFSSKAYVMQGNHDRTGKDKADNVWENVFGYLPNNGPQGFLKFAYSFDFENSHFVVLDSDKPKEFFINDTQRNWLKKDLSQNKKENAFVFFHEPAYPTNSKIGEGLDTNPKDRDALWNILTSHKVRAVFSGHEHIQSRRKVSGLYQFVFGNTDSFNHLAPKAGMSEYSYVGQGFGLVEVDGDNVAVKTYSTSGNVLNSFNIPR